MSENYYQRKGVSNTGLGYYLKSPLHYKKYIDGSYGDSDTDAKGLGSLVHAYLLENQSFKDKYVISDSEPVGGMMGKFIEELVKSGNSQLAWQKSGFKQKLDTVMDNLNKPDNVTYLNLLNQSKGKTICGKEDYTIADNIFKSVREHKTALDYIFPNESKTLIVLTEAEVYWKIEVESVKFDCKAKIDRIIINLKDFTIKVIELKTTSYPLKQFESTIKKYKYYRQGAWYTNEALKYLLEQYQLNIGDFKVSFSIVAVETEDLYQVRVLELDDNDLIQGQIEYEWILEQIAWHTSNNFWYKRDYYKKNDWIDKVSIFNENRELDGKTNVEQEIY